MKETHLNKFENRKLRLGRMISGSKTTPKGEFCVWNANVVTQSDGKIWYGDLNITKDGDKLKEVAEEIGETVFVLRESDCRFYTENDSPELLISKAVWSSKEGFTLV